MLAFVHGTSTPCLADDPDRPPPLTFDKHVDYLAWYDEFVSKGKKERDNAFELYQRLSPGADGNGGLQLPKGEIEKEFDEAFKKPWSEDQFPRLKTYLDDTVPLLALFKRGTSRTFFWQPRDPTVKRLFEIDLISKAPCRAACKILIVQSWMKSNDQASRMLSNWMVILANANHFSKQPTLVGQLISAAERSTVYQQTRRAVATRVVNATNLRTAVSIFQEHDPCKPALTQAVVVEWASILDVLQSICVDGQFDMDQFNRLLDSLDTSPPSIKVVRMGISPQKTQNDIDAYFQKVCQALIGPISSKHLFMIRDTEKMHSRLREDNLFLGVFLINFARAYELMLRTEVDRRGTILVLALHDYKFRTKRWPAKLDDLVVDSLSTLRTDPYSEKDFIYKLTDGRFTLYSVGADGKDDGGRHDPHWGEGPNGGDFVFWPVQDDSNAASQPPKKAHRGE